jgi:hypothetical protein
LILIRNWKKSNQFGYFLADFFTGNVHFFAREEPSSWTDQKLSNRIPAMSKVSYQTVNFSGIMGI